MTTASPRRGRSPAPFLFATVISATAFLGFSFTYFSPMFRGSYPEVSAAVHLHGWTFFLWYLLYPAQVALIHTRRHALHKRLGLVSIGLAAAMIFTGLVVVSVQAQAASGPDGSPFWRSFAPGVFSTLVLFGVFYALGVRYRRKVALHRRFILLASAGGLGAATFRIISAAGGGTTLAMVGGIMAPNLIVLAAIWHDYRSEGRVQRVYWWGLAASIGLEAITLSPAGAIVGRGLAALGRVLQVFY